MLPIVISRVMLIWMYIVVGTLSLNNDHKFMNIGPNDTLIIMNKPINTMSTYMGIVCISIINSSFRTINNNIISSWIINSVQDITNKDKLNKLYAYEISITHTIYTWVDFFLYMNIILNQVDFFVIEIITECISTIIITNYYVKQKEQTYILLDIL